MRKRIVDHAKRSKAEMATSSDPVKKTIAVRRAQSEEAGYVGWSLMGPGLRNDALIVYNCR